jgi:hypothetical protein
MKRLGIFLVLFALLFSGCEPSKTEVLENLVSKSKDQLAMHIFSDDDFSYEVNKVYNGEPMLLKHIQQVAIHTENDKLKWLKALGLKETRPIILIFDTEKLLYQTSEPEGLSEFVKGLAQEDTGNEVPEEKMVETNFSLEKLDAEDLTNGIFTGLEFQFGSEFNDIVELWGEPVDEGYLRGGRYYQYQSKDYDYYFFDPEISEHVKHIQITPKSSVYLNDIRNQLGEPDVDKLDEDLHETWVLIYSYRNFTLFVIGKNSAENSEVLYLSLKNEQ